LPTIDIDLAEFEKLVGRSYHGDIEELDDVLAFVKSEVKLYNKTENVVSVEIKDTNRPDLWSVEGLARGVRPYLRLEKGPRYYECGCLAGEVNVDARLKNVRPFIACSLVKDIKLSDTIIRGLMHLQDKLDKTYGRNRQKTSIGVYDLDLIRLPLSYSVARPTECSFVPLGFSEKMTLAEILERHPKGQEYGHIVKRHNLYPILLDSDEKVLSFPPVINSNDLGRVTEETRNLLVEVTGTAHKTVLNALMLVTTALVDRGGKAQPVTIQYSDDPIYPAKQVVTPDFTSQCVDLDAEYVSQIIGIPLTSGQIADLLPIAGLGVGKKTEKTVQVYVPCYRVDIMHKVDIVEDVAVAYGYNCIEPLWRDLPTTGVASRDRRLLNLVRELMVGAGYQEVLNYTLTNLDALFAKMNVPPARVLELANPKLVTMTCIRNWLLPGLIAFLSFNQSVEFPQRVFELGKVTFADESKETKTRDEEWLAAATSHSGASFSEIKSCLAAFLANLGVEWKIAEVSHGSFIDGRVGAVIVEGEQVGVVGELNPLVLQSWTLENPTAAFEVNIQRILDKIGI
jgi:phenylalanyl-tRNA synthetase beta chain